MSYLGLALLAEGPTDHQFLQPLLSRVSEDLCLNHGKGRVDIGSVFSLYPSRAVQGESREIQILEAVREAAGAFHVIFVHTDGGNDPDQARRERVQPARSRIERELSERAGKIVGVVPVREIEAWALVDGDALRASFGTSRTDQELGFPESPGDVERFLDPKRTLKEAWQIARLRARRRRLSIELPLELLGQQMSLGRLRAVPAFRRLEDELQDVLARLGYLK